MTPTIWQRGALNVNERLWARVDKQGDTDTCWLWKGSLKRGYGNIRNGAKIVATHRVAYEQRHGPIPTGMQIDHLCRVRRCVNPAHLEVVTAQENTLRGNGPGGRNARKTHCKHGHPFDNENTLLQIRAGRIGRQCRICARDRQERFWDRRKTK